MPDAVNVTTLETQRQQILQQFAQLGDLRPGSLVKTYRKCGTPTCHCAQPEARGHGPHWVLTTRVNGKTRTRAIPEASLAATRAQIAECQRLRRLVERLIRVSETACDARVQALRRRPQAPDSTAF